MSEWHPCSYENMQIVDPSGLWEDGKWYEWKDCHGDVEVARIKRDSCDHFFPDTKIIQEKNVVAFREIEK